MVTSEQSGHFDVVEFDQPIPRGAWQRLALGETSSKLRILPSTYLTLNIHGKLFSSCYCLAPDDAAAKYSSMNY